MAAVPDWIMLSAPISSNTDKRYKHLFEQSPIASLLVNRYGSIVEFNHRAADMLLIDPELISKPDLQGYLGQEYQAELSQNLNNVFDKREQQSLDIRIQIADGQEIPIRLISMPVEDDHSICQVTLLDISGQANYTALSRLAYYDNMTELPNRLLFNDRIRWAIRDARRRQEQLAVMVIDLDNFKSINDSMGHEAGDLVIKAVAAAMITCLRENDTLSRMGGDEFTILMQHITENQDVLIVAERILEAIRQPIEIMNRSLTISGSIGICLYPEDGQDAESLIHNADIAMYRSKTSGRDCIAFFNDSMREDASRQSDFERRLRDALNSGQLSVNYQPMVDGKTCKIIGLEALLRWRTDQEGMMSAGQFISQAESLGLCGTFSDWALQEACLQMKNWLDRGLLINYKNCRMAVNICDEQLVNPGLTSRISTILSYAGLPPGALAIEMTEKTLQQEDPTITENLIEMNRMGIALHLDDFSQGFSAMQKLCKIPFEYLKIDHLVTKNLMENQHREAMLETMLNLSHTMGLRVIAEGVENQQVYDIFKAHNCDGMQGYYFCHPLSALEMEMLLQIPQLS